PGSRSPASGVDGRPRVGDVDEGLVVSSIAGPAPRGLGVGAPSPHPRGTRSLLALSKSRAPRQPQGSRFRQRCSTGPSAGRLDARSCVTTWPRSQFVTGLDGAHVRSFTNGARIWVAVDTTDL